MIAVERKLIFCCFVGMLLVGLSMAETNCRAHNESLEVCKGCCGDKFQFDGRIEAYGSNKVCYCQDTRNGCGAEVDSFEGCTKCCEARYDVDGYISYNVAAGKTCVCRY